MWDTRIKVLPLFPLVCLHEQGKQLTQRDARGITYGPPDFVLLKQSYNVGCTGAVSHQRNEGNNTFKKTCLLTNHKIKIWVLFYSTWV